MIVTNWTGIEVKALRHAALRRTQPEFAALSGYSLGVVRKWEGRGRTIILSGEYAEAMDTLFQRLNETQRARFHAALASNGSTARVASYQDDSEDRLQFTARKPESIDLTAVARLHDLVSDLDESYGSEPSTTLLAQAGQYLGQTQIFQTYAPTESIRRELLAVEARSATFMSRVIWDASQRRDNATAEHYLNQSITASQKLGDAITEGRARLRQSYIALYGEKKPERGLDLTMDIVDTVGNSSNELSGVALLHQAEALAMLGRQVDCEKALSEADRRFGRIRPNEHPLGIYSETERSRLAGSCYLSLGKPKRAQAILEEALEVGRGSSKTQAIITGNISLSQIRQHAMSEAADSLHKAIDLVEETRGGAGLNIVFSACREMQPFRNLPEVRDVYDRVLALMATT